MTAPGHPAALETRYEELRCQVVAALPAGAGLGLALFLREGMAAWARAWERVPEQAAHADHERGGQPAPAGLAGDLVHLLAGMALRALN